MRLTMAPQTRSGVQSRHPVNFGLGVLRNVALQTGDAAAVSTPAPVVAPLCSSRFKLSPSILSFGPSEHVIVTRIAPSIIVHVHCSVQPQVRHHYVPHTSSLVSSY